jgi:CRISPR type IV-associated protein Csf3
MAGHLPLPVKKKESFNSWITKNTDMQIVDMLDKRRQMIITKFDSRGNIARKWRAE